MNGDLMPFEKKKSGCFGENKIGMLGKRNLSMATKESFCTIPF
jgi:hypothetical protein